MPLPEMNSGLTTNMLRVEGLEIICQGFKIRLLTFVWWWIIERGGFGHWWDVYCYVVLMQMVNNWLRIRRLSSFKQTDLFVCNCINNIMFDHTMPLKGQLNFLGTRPPVPEIFYSAKGLLPNCGEFLQFLNSILK